MKSFLQKALLKTDNKIYFVVSDVLALITIISVVSIVLETVPSLERFGHIFLIVEWISVFIFSCEYLARMYVTNPTQKYIFSFFGVVDIVSVLPSLLGLGNLTFLKSVRSLRIIRLLRMIRLAKLSHIKERDIEESLGVFALNVSMYVILLLVALLATGTVMYVVEGANSVFMSIPTAMWWSFKVFLGSIPVSTPITAAGAVMYVFARFIGLILLGVLIGVVGNIFRKLFFS
jgi:voltage-gated potassium channel